MPQHHSFLFHPTSDEMRHYIEAIEKVEGQEKFRGTVAIDIQLHGGSWTGEFSALTSRKLMDFITEVTMELPPEEQEDGVWNDIADGPLEEDASVQSDPDEDSEEFEDDSDPVIEGEEATREAADDAAYEEHEKAAGRTPPKKLKKPSSVKTSNPAITVEED